jgi:SAM-dependent methyltransferase
MQTNNFDPEYFSKLWEVEDKHFWFQARNKVIAAIVQRIVNDLPAGYRVLEVGCGTGNVLRHLERVCKHGHVIGLDLFHEGLRYAKQRVTCALVQADLHRPPFRTGFDLIGMFDVLEHLDRDEVIRRRLFEHMAMSARKKVILFTPNGFTPNDQVDGNLYQEHQSAWEPADYLSRGYTVKGTHGWRWIIGKAGLPKRKPYSLWSIVAMLTLPLVYNRPEWAAHSYAVKMV